MTVQKKIKKIKRVLPPIGTIINGKYKGRAYKAKIVRDKSQKDGKSINYSGKLYPSMTAAAKAITKNSINGWKFWKF